MDPHMYGTELDDTAAGKTGMPGEDDSRADAGTFGQGWLVPLLTIIAGIFVSVLDTSIVTVALPAMQQAFGASVRDIQWVANAYTLCMGAVVPASSWLAARSAPNASI